MENAVFWQKVIHIKCFYAYFMGHVENVAKYFHFLLRVSVRKC